MNFVACRQKARIMVSLLGGWALACAASTPARAQSYVFVRSFGTSGSGNGELNSPSDIKIDSFGNIFVADTNNNRVEEFSVAGTYLNQFGRRGNGDGQFNSPLGIAIDSSNNIFVSDTNANFARVEKFTNVGGVANIGGTFTYQAQFGRLNTTPQSSEFGFPIGLAFDSGGSIYVVDNENDRVRKYAVAGNTFTQTALQIGGTGNGDGQLDIPYGIAIDKNNNIFVANSNNYRVEEYSSSGAFIRNFTITDPDLDPSNPDYNRYFRPHYIAIDNSGNVLVSDFAHNFIAQFSDTGQYLGQFGTTGTGDGEFSQAGGIAVDAAGNVYVTDTGGNRVEEFAFVAAVPETGTLLTLACMTVGGLCVTRRLKKERLSQPATPSSNNQA